jgi:hypothetical protein
MKKITDNTLAIIGLVLLGLFLFFATNVFAMNVSEVKDYVHKQVLITYKEDGILKADSGLFFTLLDDKEDYTFDKIYSYIVLYSYKNTLEVIKIKDIKTIEEIK